MSTLTFGLTPYWQGVVIVAAIGAIAALGLQLTIASGQFSLVHGALAGVGSYAAGLVSVERGAGFLLACLVGAVSGAVLGCLTCVVLRRLDGVLFGLATLAIGQAMTLYASNSEMLGGTTGYIGVPLRTQLWHVLAALALVLVLISAIKNSRSGMALVAVGRDPVVAASLGLPVLAVKVAAFGVGGAVAGLAGALNVQYVSFVDPSALNFNAEVQLLLFVVIGGMTTPWGALAGAFGVTVTSELLRFTELDRAWVLGLVLTLVALLRPQGLLNRRGIDVPWTQLLPTWGWTKSQKPDTLSEQHK